MQLLGTKGQKFHPCPGTKGQRDKLKILPRDGILTACPVPSWKIPRQPWDKREKRVKKYRFLKQKLFSINFYFIFQNFGLFLTFFVLGCPRTDEFVPGFLLLLLSRDKGTAGQGFFLTLKKGRQVKKTFLS